VRATGHECESFIEPCSPDLSLCRIQVYEGILHFRFGLHEVHFARDQAAMEV
jgi:hypothetical protein